jgi:hypothetical protein
MKPFPKFSVQRVEHSPPALVGQLSSTAFESETWVRDGAIGVLRSGATFISGRWQSTEAAWLFAPDNATALHGLRPPCEFDVFDGYWGERAELVLDQTLIWQAAIWLDAADHDHCRVCWNSISATENSAHFVAAAHLRVCAECHAAYVRGRSLSFITPRPAA